MDFLNFLEPDVSIRILTSLEDPSDLVHFSAVSRSWRHYVIANGFCKQLCLRMFPQLSRVDHVIESRCSMKKPAEVGSSKSVEWESLEREHRVYSFLARGLTSFPFRECIDDAISASSTDNDPEESIHNTLEPRDRVARRASYWSSKGQTNSAVPETLTYKLVADLCVITEINIQPFEAFFQQNRPIYSANSVRFRMGHLESPTDDLMGESCMDDANNKFVWTYTSQEFPMSQENCLQKFKLPEPVLCIGGILQIELLGRVQRQEMDGLFYICVSHVKVMGRPLAPTFGVKILEPSGKFALMALSYTQPLEDEHCATSSVYLQRRVRDLEQIVEEMLRGNEVDVEEFEWDEEDDESDEEFVD